MLAPSLVERASYTAKETPVAAPAVLAAPLVLPTYQEPPLATPKNTDKLIVVESRLVSTAVGFGADAMLPKMDELPVILTERESRLIDDKVSSDRRATVLSSPRLTLVEGQKGTVQIGHEIPISTAVKSDEPTRFQFAGYRQSILVRTQPNGKPMHMQIECCLSEKGTQPGAVNTRSVATTMEVQPGQTVVVPFGVRCVQVAEMRVVPTVSMIPYVGRLFVNHAVPQQEQEQYLFVTARVMKPRDVAAMSLVAQPVKATAVTPTCCEYAALACAEATSPAAALVAEYRKACAAGKTEEAMRIAMKALSADPKCFSESR